MKNNKENKIGFAAPLNKLEWEDNVQKQLIILQLSCLLSYTDVGKDVLKCAYDYLCYINTGNCTDTHTSDKYEAFCKVIDSINNLRMYNYYPKNVKAIIINLTDAITSTLVSNMNAGNEYYIGCIIDSFYRNFRQLFIRYGKDLNITLDSTVNTVYNISFEVYPKDKHYRKNDTKLVFDVVHERVLELYSKTCKEDDEVHDNYVTKTFSIYNSTFQINITVKDSSKVEHRTVKTLASQPVILELDELKFDNEAEIDNVVMSTLLTTMFTKSNNHLKQLVKDTLIQMETYQPTDQSNVQATKQFVINNFLRIDHDKSVRFILYNELNNRFSNNYNLSRLQIQDELNVDFTSILYRLANILLARYEQLEPIYTTYYRILKEYGPDSLKRRTTHQGCSDHLYIQYCDKETDKHYRIMRITSKSR